MPTPPSRAVVPHRVEPGGEDERDVLLHGDVILPFRLVAERRTKLKKWDVVTGRAAPNYGKLYAAQGHKWVVLHVLRVNQGFREQFEKRAMAAAECEMAQRGLALHGLEEVINPRQDVINPVLSRDARAWGRGTSSVEQEAGLVIERVLDDGKSRFRGVVYELPHASPCATPDLAHASPRSRERVLPDLGHACAIRSASSTRRLSGRWSHPTSSSSSATCAPSGGPWRSATSCTA